MPGVAVQGVTCGLCPPSLQSSLPSLLSLSAGNSQTEVVPAGSGPGGHQEGPGSVACSPGGHGGCVGQLSQGLSTQGRLRVNVGLRQDLLQPRDEVAYNGSHISNLIGKAHDPFPNFPRSFVISNFPIESRINV